MEAMKGWRRAELVGRRQRRGLVEAKTYRKTIVFDYDGETGLSGRRPFVDLSTEAKLPDGLTVDEEGGIWVALYEGGAVRRYTPDGVLDEVIEVPAKRSLPAPSAARTWTSCSSPHREKASSQAKIRWPALCSGPKWAWPDCRFGSSPDERSGLL
jgi:hypothetical protein